MQTMLDAVLRHRDGGGDVDDCMAVVRALGHAGISLDDVRTHFGSLGRLERTAGVVTIPRDEYREPATLLADLHRVARSLQRAPLRGEYRLFGRYPVETLRRRFHTDQWAVILRAYGAYLVRHNLTHQVSAAELERLGVPDGRVGRDATSRTHPCAAAPAPVPQSRPTARPLRRVEAPLLGPPLAGVPGFTNAPVNEQTLVAIFCAVAFRMGFVVKYADERRFPDVWALQRVPGREDRWREVRVELELRATDFNKHDHDPAEVDVLVVWEDNWPAAERERAPHVQVIDLQRALRALPPLDGAPGAA